MLKTTIWQIKAGTLKHVLVDFSVVRTIDTLDLIRKPIEPDQLYVVNHILKMEDMRATLDEERKRAAALGTTDWQEVQYQIVYGTRGIAQANPKWDWVEEYKLFCPRCGVTETEDNRVAEIIFIASLNARIVMNPGGDVKSTSMVMPEPEGEFRKDIREDFLLQKLNESEKKTRGNFLRSPAEFCAHS